MKNVRLPREPRGEPHAITRARERYGIEITIDELKALTLRCKQGEGRTMTLELATGHTLVFRDRVINVRYMSVENGGAQPNGTILTVIPNNDLHQKQQASHDLYHTMRRKGRKARWRKTWA